ncbi:MAG: alpha/beta hydrolase [Burkholderiales bacterium]|nr:MAG: alpha/beta hydrolase [Burkholderiales bacterium]
MLIDVHGTPTYAYTGGRPFDAALPVVVFIHGGQHDHSVWALQSRYLAHHGYAVLALDLPGHGRSIGEALGSIEAIAQWLVALLDAAGVDRATLVGHSMGSLVALEVAGRTPGRVERLVMVSTAFPMKVADALLSATRDDEPRALDMINYWSHSTINARPGSPAPGFSIFVQNRRLMERQRPGVLHADFAACNAYAGGFDRADTLACPTLFVLGQRDMMTQPRHALALMERCRTAAVRSGLPPPTVLEIPDCGHSIASERPDALLAALRDFLAAPVPARLA